MKIEVRTKEQQAIDNLKTIIEIEPPIEDTAQILLDYITNLQEKNERLNNVINELEKYLEEHSKIDFESSDIILHEQLALSVVYDYLKSLKEGK